jgi:hypothetical protein
MIAIGDLIIGVKSNLYCSKSGLVARRPASQGQGYLQDLSNFLQQLAFTASPN